MTAETPVLFEKDGAIAWITLNRPAVLNALDLRMRDELWTALGAVRADPDVGVVILRGAGERAFSAGADLNDFGTAPSFIEARRARLERDLWGLLLAIEKPLIAAIQGYALGAGLELGLLCDLRIASDDARLGLPEVGLAYMPTAGGSQTLPRTIGRGRALHMVLSGEPASAAEALAMGIVQWVVPRAELYEAAAALARRVLARPQTAVRLAKAADVRGADLPLPDALRLEAMLRCRAAATG